jgi:hypothetical protein
MVARELTLTKTVAGIFIIFYVLIPIARIAYHTKYSESAGKPILCSGCREMKPQFTSNPEQRDKIECRINCINTTHKL